MEDGDIIELYWQRSEDAIAETKRRYHPYCTTIVYHILGSFEDTEEVVADTYLKIWNSIPPARPRYFKAFLGRIAHNLAIDRYRAGGMKKYSSLSEVLDELEIAALEDPAEEAQRRALAEAVSRFLYGLDSQTRIVFVLRYWNYDSISAISGKTGIKETTINSMLYRTRKKLKAWLVKEGWNDET